MNKRDIEDFILSMADLVYENRMLRKENEYLHNKIKENDKIRQENFKESQKMMSQLLRDALHMDERNDNYDEI